MAEVSGLLSNNDLLRTRLARNLDLYTRSGSVTPMGSSSFSSTSSSDPTPALSSTPSPLHLNPSTQSNPPPHPHLNPNFTLPKPTTTTLRRDLGHAPLTRQSSDAGAIRNIPVWYQMQLNMISRYLSTAVSQAKNSTSLVIHSRMMMMIPPTDDCNQAGARLI